VSDEEQWLVLSPRNLIFGISPDGSVVVRLGYEDTALGLAPGVALAMEMTPGEARIVGHSLLRKADEAEARGSRH